MWGQTGIRRRASPGSIFVLGGYFMDETGQGNDPAAFPTETAGNGSKQPSPEEEQSLVTRPNTDEGNGQQSNRKYTGPRTREGKNRTDPTWARAGHSVGAPSRRRLRGDEARRYIFAAGPRHVREHGSHIGAVKSIVRARWPADPRPRKARQAFWRDACAEGRSI